MLHILSITGPIYLIIAAGFLTVRAGVFEPPDMRVLGRFVINFSLPALLFRAISQRPLGEVLDGVFLLAYTLGSLLVLFGAVAYLRRVQGRPLPVAALHGLGMSGSNSGFVGFPIVLQLLGPPAGVALALTMMVENLLIIPLAMAMADSSAGSGLRWHRALAQSARGLLRNPMILAIIAGFASTLLGVQWPETVLRTIQIVANAASPVALFVIGGSLVGMRLQGMRGDIARVAVGKLVLHPLAVLGALLLLPPFDPVLRTAAVAFACMPMLSIYPLLAHKHGEQAFSAAALLVTTIASFLTISGWLWLLDAGLGWPG